MFLFVCGADTFDGNVAGLGWAFFLLLNLRTASSWSLCFCLCVVQTLSIAMWLGLFFTAEPEDGE